MRMTTLTAESSHVGNVSLSVIRSVIAFNTGCKEKAAHGQQRR